MFSEIIIVALFLVNCGYVETGPNPLTVIGGNDIGIRIYKFLVSVKIDEDNVDDCAGSLISPNYVITVAHCVHGHIPDKITVLVGSTNPDEVPAGLLFEILEPIYEHPYYDDTTKLHDISLLRLCETLDFNPSNDIIGAVPLPILGGMTDELNMTIKAIGFGERVNERGEEEYTNTLKKANLKIKINTLCEAQYRITLRSQICAEYEDGYVNYHDEGAPVLFKDELFGIVSRTEVNRRQRGYTILVRVINYLNFILETMALNP